jgi:hypothetical protein
MSEDVLKHFVIEDDGSFMLDVMSMKAGAGERKTYPPLEGGSKFGKRISGRGHRGNIADPSPKNFFAALRNFVDPPSRGG